MMSPALRRLLGYSCAILTIAISYYVYVLTAHPPSPMQETFLSEVGEGIGEIALWAFVAIYIRTLAKIALGKGPISRRLLPDYRPQVNGSLIQRILSFLDRSHVFLGIAAVALVLLHIALMGLHAEIRFFPVILALVLWQAGFGFFLSWRQVPKNLKRWSYFVHAQLITGVAIGIFAYFGHLLLDD